MLVSVLQSTSYVGIRTIFSQEFQALTDTASKRMLCAVSSSPSTGARQEQREHLHPDAHSSSSSSETTPEPIPQAAVSVIERLRDRVFTWPHSVEGSSHRVPEICDVGLCARGPSLGEDRGVVAGVAQ